MKTPLSIQRPVLLGMACLANLLAPAAAAQIHAMNYDTPATVEVETDRIVAREGARTVDLHLSRTGEFRVSTRIDFETVDGTAVAGEDYQASGGTLVFKPGEGFKTITIRLLHGTGAEGTETFQVRLTAPDPKTILPQGTVEISVEDSNFQAASVPALEIAGLTGGGIRLSWIAAGNLVLERAEAARSQAWQAFPCSIATTNGVSEVFEPCAGAVSFYRLRRE